MTSPPAAREQLPVVRRERARSSRIGAARVAVALLTALALTACAPAPVTRALPGEGLPPHDARLALPGPHPASVGHGALRSAYGCELRFEVHTPEGVDDRSRATLLLAHGFLRDLRHMRGWAAHLASHGVRTVVVSFCNSTPFDGRHDRNADDLRALAAVVAPDGAPVLYAGFSAGGLAAYLATASDARAVAYLGLDTVDSGALAASVAPPHVPALFLAAEPSRCNADGNVVPLAQGLPTAQLVPVRHATHCDFEHPTSRACERLCGRVEPPEAAAAIRGAVRALATAWVLEHAWDR